MKRITLTLLFVLGSSAIWAQSTARYTVTFQSNWSQTAHPHTSGSLPAGAHWSRLVGATHNSDVSFLAMGELATPGIEAIAESGSNGLFFNEVDSAIASGFANQSINGPDLDSDLGTITINSIETSTEFPLLTLASMIAPSPDWMIAISGVSLVDTDGDWLDEITIDLYAYDAGTDSGIDYQSPNMNTSPAEVISSLQGVSPFSSEIIGTITISLDEILSVDDLEINSIQLQPNPVQNELEISASQSGFKSFTIYNPIGTAIMDKQINGANNARIDVSSLQSGIYLIRLITTENKVVVRKLVKR